MKNANVKAGGTNLAESLIIIILVVSSCPFRITSRKPISTFKHMIFYAFADNPQVNKNYQ